MSFHIFRFAILFLTVCLSSCITLQYNISNGKDRFLERDDFNVGATSIDITPLPGQPLGGYGNDIGQISKGYWTRLYANTTYLVDVSGNYMVIVTADLWSIPEGLRDNVLSKLQEDNHKFRIAPERFLLSATHTHYSQGNYSTSFGYNQGSSAKSGFDRDMFNFLTDRIVFGIKKAMSSTQAASISYSQFDLAGVSRNRSFKAFLANPDEIKNEFYDRIDDPDRFLNSENDCFVKSDSRAFQAINPQVTTIIFTSKKDSQVISMINSFAAHPTVLGPTNSLFSSDVYGVSSLHLKSLFKQKQGDPVIHFLQAESGDVSFNWRAQNMNECIRLGFLLSESIYKNAMNNLRPLPESIMCKLESKRISDHMIFDDPFGEIECLQELRTTKKPLAGKSVLYGAEDGRVTKNIDVEYLIEGKVDECRFEESDRNKNCHSNHGRKNPYNISKLAQRSAPDFIPIGIFSIGGLHLITLPGEINSALGYRIKEGSFNMKIKPNPIIVSLANEYLSYFSTPSEYNEQHYEGGFTVYGGASGLYLIEEVNRIHSYGRSRIATHPKKKYSAGPFRLRKKSVQKDLRKMGSQELECLDLYLDNNKFKKIEWEIAAKLFTMSESCFNLLPSISVEEQISPGVWSELKISLKSESGIHLAIPQNDKESYNLISYVDYRGDNFKWNTYWMVDKEYNNSNNLRMKFIDCEGIEYFSDIFLMQ